MKKQLRDTRWMAGLAMMMAVLLTLFFTGVGLLPLPVIKATTMHIPVILGAVLLGPLAGGILGGVFGLCSVWANTMTPAVTSFAFSPFLSTTGIPGALKALWVAVGCRILIGVVAGWLWVILKRVHLSDFVAMPLVAAVGSMTNTVCVLGSIYLLFAQQYAEAKQVAMSALFTLIMGTVTTTGVAEVIAAVILVTAIGKALLRLRRPGTAEPAR